uniref:Uncharacterized protein n=1 Tax=Arundo donax TaxID=35708 RepID=A0A0A9CFF9_ARUDO
MHGVSLTPTVPIDLASMTQAPYPLFPPIHANP